MIAEELKVGDYLYYNTSYLAEIIHRYVRVESIDLKNRTYIGTVIKTENDFVNVNVGDQYSFTIDLLDAKRPLSKIEAKLLGLP